ncbi:MAG: hypothetical protein ACI909_003559 [Planctomycetota bacterium]|jgi:hypothetical protein
MEHLMTIKTWFVTSLLFLTLLPLAEARLYVQVIGINDYIMKNADLDGAVNDANDIWTSVALLNPSESQLLIDEAATRKTILTTWQRYLDDAGSGDTILITYSGHGAKEADSDATEELDGYEEVMVLAGFQSDGSASRERIFDNEIDHLAWKAHRKGINLIFLADACFSGGLTRSFDPDSQGSSAPKSRFTSYQLANDQLSRAEKRPDKNQQGVPSSFVFLSAQTEEEVIYEIDLPLGQQKKRGALSYAFSRAIEGQADFNKDAVLSRRELFGYLQDKVPALSDYLQEPELLPKSNPDKVVFTLGKTATNGPSQDEASKLRVWQPVANTVDISMLVMATPGTENNHHFQWNSQTGVVFNATQDRVAEKILKASQLEHVLVKWQLVDNIRRNYASGVSVRLVPPRKLHCKGDRLSLKLDSFSPGYLYLFNLTGPGTLEFFWPWSEEENQVIKAPWNPIKFSVKDNFGADHLIAILSPRPILDLDKDLLQANKKPLSTSVIKRFQNLANQADIAWGTLGLFTSERNATCGDST